MPKALATREAVFQVADELAARGQQPGPNAVLERLGGSYTTISKHLKDWRAAQQAAAPLVLPPELVAQTTEFTRVLWTAAHADAQRDLALLRIAHAQQLSTANAELADAAVAIEHLEMEHTRVTGTIAVLHQREAQVQHTLAEAEAAQRVAEGRLVDIQAALERAAHDQRTLQERLDIQLQRSGAQAVELEALRHHVQAQNALIERFMATTAIVAATEAAKGAMETT